jgi:ABC-type transport system substrate-binding protein/serine/threonine protein kinase
MIHSKLADRYEVVSELGRGGMGVVYRARDPRLNRDVAVKVVASSELSSDTQERFQREAQIVAQMDHPGIVPIHDVGRHEGSYFFVMPLVVGTSLRHLLWDGSLRLGEVLDIAIQTAEALEYSHSRGVVHRDIKPENIMVTREEGGNVRVRVMDFGLAHASSDNRLTKTGTLVGTVTYLSPEQVTAHAFDGRSDIYSLGTVLYECLAGEPPFAGESQAVLYRIVHEIPQPPRALGADIREGLQSIVMQCLEKDPSRRPQRAIELVEALRRSRASLASDEYSMSLVNTASRVLQRPAPSAFIGREKEFAELQHRLNAAIAGDCQFVAVAGEPGIGKTRLLEELKKLATMRKIRVLYGRFVELDRAFSYQGFCELVQDYFRTKDTGSSASERPDFSDLAPDLLSLFPQLTEISELRSVGSADSRIAPTVAERKAEDRIQVFELIARTLVRIAAGKPLVLILENLHGAEVSIEALQYIVRRLGPTPTLIVGSYRHTETDRRHPLTRMLESFADDPRFASITLGPFSPSEHRALVESVVGASSLAEGLAEKVREATEGNPFFTKELLRSLLDSGGIAKDPSGAWTFSKAAGISSDALPATIQQAVEKRIEHLPEDLRELLSVASVLGRSFEFRDLETLAEGMRNLDESAERLIREGILEEERASRGDRLAFSSGIVRDVLYSALSRRRRRSLHRRYAEIIEERYAGRLDRVYPDLVHHFSQADVPEKTVEYGLKLAQKSLEAFSPDDAIRTVKTALEYLQDGEWSGDRTLEGEARLLLAHAHRISGAIDTSLREVEGAVRIFERAGRPERSVAAILLAAETAWQSRLMDEASRWVERGLDPARSLEKPEALTKLLSLAATVANLRGEYPKAAGYLAEIERISSTEKPHEEEEAVPRGGTLVVAMANPVAVVEPATYQTTEESEVIANVVETLVTTDPQGNLVPALAESWALEDQGRAFRLRLRRDIVFSDGTPLTAQIVKSCLERSIRLSRDLMPPAFAAISGVPEFLDGGAAEVAGITTTAGDEVLIRLDLPLPIYPALLTDGRTSIALPAGTEDGSAAPVLGTGPFRFVEHAPERVVLERNERYRRELANLDRIEFRPSLSASAIAAELKAGRVDLARDLLPQDREAILREPRFRTGLVEHPKKNTYFVLFNSSSAAGSNVKLREALAKSVRVRDIVWGTLGRFALPATGIVPPGVLGHDPGRRHPHVSHDKAADLVRSAGLDLPLRLRASVHPILRDQYGALTAALFGSWAELGVEVTSGTRTMPEYLDSWNENAGIDLIVGRWIADYDDPDNFSFSLFHSGKGLLRKYFSSPETDQILEDARRESRPEAREALYRRFEHLLLDAGILIPLFHDVDYRIAAPTLRGLQLKSTSPFVNYTEVGKAPAEAAPVAGRHAGGGILQIPVPGVVGSLDPAIAWTVEQGEVLPVIFESLTKEIEGARVVPWLASEVVAENNGMRFRFRLRPGVRFHDGRRLTSRDVRYSFERLLQSTESESRWVLTPVRGAKRLQDGSASELEGFHIVSPSEFFIDLEKPVSFFPALVSYQSASIVPEGTRQIGGSWRDGCVGTGPFRVLSFEPGKRLELDRNPGYWRDGYPRSEGIVFRFGIPPAEILSEFLAGRFSIASSLLPPDAERLRHDPVYASGYRESPRLSTYWLAFNRRHGVFQDGALRASIANALDVPATVKRTMGRLAIPASGLIPPGLLGYSADSPKRDKTSSAGQAPLHSAEYTVSRESTELTAIVHPVYFGECAPLLADLAQQLREMGFTLKVLNDTMVSFQENRFAGLADLVLARWASDYPDADTFVHGLLHSREGNVGNFVGTEELDLLIEKGRSEIEPRARHAIYRQVEDRIAREAILVPLFHEQTYVFARPGVDGLSLGFSSPVVAYEKLSIRR